MDDLVGKAQEALGHFLEDPQKVEKAKDKAEDLLSRRMSHDEADQVVDTAEGLVERFARHEP